MSLLTSRTILTMDSDLPGTNSHSSLRALEQCSFCSKTLSSKKHLKRHLLTCKKNTSIDVPTKLTCICGSAFSRKDNLIKHVKNCGLKRKKEKIQCLYSHCKESFYEKLSLINHLKSIHQSSIDPVQTFKFNDESEFLSWKEKEETKALSYYPKACGKKTSQINIRNYYYCQHNGPDAAHRKVGEPARKSSRKRQIGQIKRNFTCISKITEVVFANGTREVLYYPTHNHPLSEQDIPHQPVPTTLNKLINTQIALNVPSLEIHHSVQASVSGRENRCLVSSKEDKRKIAISKRLIQQRISKKKHRSRLNPNDIVSVSLKVEQLQQEQYNPIVIFKPTGWNSVSVDTVEHPVDENIFMLGMQTETQRKLMLEGCKKILVMDDTHCVTQYENMKLLNILIVDEHNKGWPVGHFISNNMTANTIALFIKAIKYQMETHQEDLVVNCLITDDDPALINGLESGMSTKVNHILCQWHLINAFKDNIRAKCPALFEVIFTDLKTIILAKNRDEFDKLTNGFRTKYAGKADSFIDYLDSYYFQRCEKWAMCHRGNLKHGNVNTTAHVESFHNKLKKVYFNRKPNKRMDDLLDVLLTIEQDDYATRQREIIFNHKSVENLIIDRWHKNGMELPDTCIHKISDTLWEVESPLSSLTYHVYQLEKICSHDFCYVKCTQPSCHDLCGHLYTCSCPENNALLCKHIHKVHSLAQRHIPNPTLENLGEPEEVEFFNVPEESCHSVPSVHTPSVANALKKLQTDLSNLTQMVNDGQIPDNLVSPLSVEINGLLKKYTALSGEIQTSGERTIDIPNRVTIAPRQKLITQQHQTLNPLKRKDKNKKNNIDVNIIMSQREAARQQLLSLDVENRESVIPPSADVVSDIHDYCLTSA